MTNLTNLVALLGSWANQLPAVWRKRIYTYVKYLSGAATVALLVLPELPSLGVNLNDSQRWGAVLTGALALLGHLAASNTTVDPEVDVNPAPEVKQPVEPS